MGILGRLKMINKWQPIETAPKDGTFIMLYRCDGNEKRPIITGASFDGYVRPSKWVDSHFQKCKFEPTHWMPLPEPPGKKDKVD